MKQSRRFFPKHLKYVLVMLPTLGIWFTLNIYPQIEVFYLAFFKWNGFSKIKKFVGWQNFETVLNDPYTPRYITNTLLYVLFLFVIQSVLAVLFSLILQKNTLHNRGFKTFFFLPMVFSSVMVGLTWSYMYDPNLGILNNLLTWLGFQEFAGFDWLGESVRAIFFIVVVHTWAGLGYAITILAAGLSTVPGTLYEAAACEGASSGQVFRRITVPLVMPTFLRLSLLTLTTGAMAFDYVQIMGASASLIKTPFDTISVFMYRATQSSSNLGISAVWSFFLAVVLILLFAVQYLATKKADEAVGV